MGLGANNVRFYPGCDPIPPKSEQQEVGAHYTVFRSPDHHCQVFHNFAPRFSTEYPPSLFKSQTPHPPIFRKPPRHGVPTSFSKCRYTKNPGRETGLAPGGIVTVLSATTPQTLLYEARPGPHLFLLLRFLLVVLHLRHSRNCTVPCKQYSPRQTIRCRSI